MTTTPPLPRTLPAWIKALDDAPLPAFAAVHGKVRLALRDASKSMRQIAELIQDSPVLALRFIQEANRGIGDGQPAESLEVALSRIGLQRAEALLAQGGRRLLGIAGTPGAGKSTVAELLAAALGERAVVVPMDGYHLANRELARLGRAQRKGAPDTFDARGYRALLQRLKTPVAGETVYAPMFNREIEEPIANAIPVHAETQLVISEGNYLLLTQAPWSDVAEVFDECWYVRVDPTERRERLVARHMHFGRSRADAEAWVESTDEPNARLIDGDRARADLVVEWRDGATVGKA